MRLRYLLVWLICCVLWQQAAAQLANVHIALDPGHGGSDVGATGIDGSAVPNEEDLVLRAALELRKLLTAAGASVSLTRDSDWEPSLSTRRDHFNAEDPDVAISLHLNSATSTAATGTETWYYHNSVLAQHLQTGLINEMKLTDRGIKQNNWTVLTCNAAIPAALTEGCFISNQADFDFVSSEVGFQAWVRGHERGIYAFLKAEYEGVPAAPTLQAVLPGSDYPELALHWSAQAQSNLSGFRLYYATPKAPHEWHLAAGEAQLGVTARQYQFGSPADFVVPSADSAFLFRLTAINSRGQESAPDDVYALQLSKGAAPKRILVVDGYDRPTGSWGKPTHDFSSIYHQLLRAAAVHTPVVASCANEAVESGELSLSPFDLVLWFLGDESTADETLSAKEQKALSAYLDAGGKLLISGSELGWDLDTRGTDADRLFYTSYLKARLANDGEDTNKRALGQGENFGDVRLSFGLLYPEDYPDEILPQTGAETIFQYNHIGTAGLAYTGPMGSAGATAQLIYLAFPLESVLPSAHAEVFMARALHYFGFPARELAMPALPEALFTASQTELVAGQELAFNNLSRQAVRYLWVFSGAVPGTSTAENPVVRYPNPGVFDVRLIAYNELQESDTLLLKALVNVVPATTNTDDLVPSFKVKLYPQPAVNQLTVELSVPMNAVECQILTLQGQPLRRISFSGLSHVLPLDNLAAGNYLLFLRAAGFQHAVLFQKK